MKLSTVFIFTILSFNTNSFAECTSSPSLKEKAISKLWSVPEVRNWREYVYAHAGKKPIVLDGKNSKQFKGKCFLSLDAYSDEGDHIHRWHSFYIHPNQKTVYIDNTEGEFLSLSKWRSTKDGKGWRTNNLNKK